MPRRGPSETERAKLQRLRKESGAARDRGPGHAGSVTPAESRSGTAGVGEVSRPSWRPPGAQLRAGTYLGVPRPPFTPGYELVGVVEELGADFSRLRVGDG